MATDKRPGKDVVSEPAAQGAAEPASYAYVRDPAALEELIRSIEGGGRVAIDIEADSLYSYFEKVCLIQLTVRGRHFVLDPLAELDLTGFIEALAERPLIFHGGNYDLRMMRSLEGFRPRGEVFDTMIAAQLLGFEQIGLASLVEKFFGIAMTKDSQKSDWSRRPLSDKQLRYAVNDTRYLEDLAERMHEELARRGRVEWQRESCRAMVDAAARHRPDDTADAWRIKGAGRLTPRQLAYLRELWRWRDMRARRADRPTFKVLGNRQLLELVQWVEANPDEPLDQGPKLPRNFVGSWRRTLEKAIAGAAALTPEEWPGRVGAVRVHPPPMDLKLLDALREEYARIARELEVAPSTLAPKAALEAMVQQRPRSLQEVMAGCGLLRWQAEFARPALDAALHASPQAR